MMKEFEIMYQEIIEKNLGSVLFENQYKMVVNRDDNIYFAKRYSEKLAFYVRCNVNSRNSLNMDFYFTAIQVPDDSIYNTNIGVNIYIGFMAGDNEEKINIAGKRILEIEKNIGHLEEMVLSELEKPFFILEANKEYYARLLVYNTVNSDENLSKEFMLLKEKSTNMIQRSEKNELSELSSQFVDKLETGYFKNRNLQYGIDEIKKYLAEQMYAECVLDA